MRMVSPKKVIGDLENKAIDQLPWTLQDSGLTSMGLGGVDQ